MDIYRFVSFFELYDLIVNKKLKYTKLSLMDDKNEGLGIAIGEATKLYNILESSHEGITKKHFEKLNTNYISCWTKEKDLIAMWLLYSKNKDYIRIKTSKEKLEKYTNLYTENAFFMKNYQSKEGTIQTLFPNCSIDEIKYIDFEDLIENIKQANDSYKKECAKIFINNSLTKDIQTKLYSKASEERDNITKEALFFKDKAYQHEKEIRSTFEVNVRNNISYEEFLKLKKEDELKDKGHYLYKTISTPEPLESLPSVIHIEIADDFIEEICFDPRTPTFQKNIYIQALKLKENDEKITTSNIFGVKSENLDLNLKLFN